MDAHRLADLLERSGHPCQAHLLRGEALFRKRRYLRAWTELNAMGEFNDVLERSPEIRLRSATYASLCLIQLGKPDQAEYVLHYVVANWPKDLQPRNGLVDAHRGLFTVYYDQGAMGRAVDHLRAWAALEPGDGRPYRTAGLIYKDMEQYPDAIAAYRHALARHLAPLTAEEVRVELAEVLIKQGKYAQGLETLQGAKERPEVLTPRAECAWALGNASEARVLLDRALTLKPDSGDALRLLARIHRDAREPEKAAPLLELALRADPSDVHSRNLLAQAYESLNQPAKAREERRRLQETKGLLDKLSELSKEAGENPWDSDVRKRLAETCQKLQRPDLARMWQRAAQACMGVRDQLKALKAARSAE